MRAVRALETVAAAVLGMAAEAKVSLKSGYHLVGAIVSVGASLLWSERVSAELDEEAA